MMQHEENYYPLSTGNSWTMKAADGTPYTLTVRADNGNGAFTIHSTFDNKESVTRKTDGSYFSDFGGILPEAQLMLKDDLHPGDTWNNTFRANGLDNVLVMTVKEVLPSKTVEGREYKNVAVIESESKMVIGGNLTSIGYFTQYYYAKGVGLILTTSSAGDYSPLVDYTLK